MLAHSLFVGQRAFSPVLRLFSRVTESSKGRTADTLSGFSGMRLENAALTIFRSNSAVIDDYIAVTSEDGETYEFFPTDALLSFLQRMAEGEAEEQKLALFEHIRNGEE